MTVGGVLIPSCLDSGLPITQIEDTENQLQQSEIDAVQQAVTAQTQLSIAQA